MREAGHLLEKVHDGLIPYIKPGVSTKEIDRIGEQMIRDLGCIPNFLNYGGFPASFCISLNDEVVHGIPSEEKIIQEGDLVKIDAGLIYKGYHSDAARTYAVGEVSPQARKLMDVTRECFFEGLKAARAGNHLNDISKAIGAHAAKYHYGIVRDLVGHGIGTHLHEDPQIPNFPQKRIAHDLINGVDFLLEGMTLDVVSDASTETVLYADMPIKVQMKITYTEPGLKGDTATNTLKPATVESGATVRVPLFINEGETIEIDTRDGSYVGRVKA